MLEKGQPAPTFTLTADDGKPVSLADFRGKRVVIYFYPKADTPGCTVQACAIRDNWVNIEAKGALVLGISPDQPPDLVKFRQKYNLPFPLLSDPDHWVAEAYGAWDGRLIRSHFGIDEQGNLTDIEIKVKPQTTADLALKLVSL